MRPALACNREPEGGHGIPSQPTISRLENVPDARTLYKIGIGYIDFFCRSYTSCRRHASSMTPPTSIVLDIDDADDLVHGQQELALFNTHAGGHCFQPIHIFEGNSGKPILSLLRPGKRPSGEEIARVLRHVIRASAGAGPTCVSWCAATPTTARRKCWICCVVCAATTSSVCRSM